MKWTIFFLWLTIALAGVAIDVLSSGFLFVWFSASAICAMIASWFGASFLFQVIIFVVLSAILITVAYPIVKKTLKDTVPETKTMEETYIGQVFVADKDIENQATIKIEGIYWTVINQGEKIKKGEKFIIKSLQGTKFIVALKK